MMNKPMMGQQPAPAAPTGMSFQSDPGMRSQFKGFMSGMAARNVPAPMPQPAMMMPQVPSQLANVDVFQPVQSFFRGGSVDRSGNSIPGDYAGGQGPGRSGGFSGSGAYSGGVRESGGKQSYSADDISFGNQDDGGSDPVMDALSRAIATTQAVNEAEQAMAVARQPQQMANRTELQRGLDGSSAEQLAQMNRAKQAAIASMSAAGPQIDTVYDFDTSDAPIVADLLSVEPFGGYGEAMPSEGPMSRPSTLIDYSDPTMVPVQPSMAPATVSGPTPMDAGEFSGANIDVRSPDDIIREQRRGPSGPPQVGDLGAMGESAFPAAPEMESVMDRALRKDDMSGARQLVQRGFGAGMEPMDQLQMRTERDLFEERAPGIGGMIQEGINAIARGASGKVMEKIQAGGTPVYDNNGQIVGVYDQSGLFGSTVYTGQPGFENPELARQLSLEPGNESTLPESMRTEIRKITDPQEDDAAFDLLKMIGFKSG